MLRNVSSLRFTILAGFITTGIMALAPLGAAQAETIPFNEVILYSINPEGDQSNQGYYNYYSLNTINSAPVSAVSEVYSEAGNWGSVNANGSADLATGQLKMRVAATMGDGSAPVSPYIKSNAIFGDGFRANTPGGQPFNWTSGSQAQFTLDLSGTMDISAGGMTDTFHPGLFIVLSILAPGTLDPNTPLINGPTAQQYFFWNIGNEDATVAYQDQNGNNIPLTATEYYDTIPDTITADFTPNGDFDWVLFLAGSGQVFDAGQSFDYDLSHTLDLSYQGPAGAMTSTVSGQFGGLPQVLPPSVPVPEPGSLLLLLGAIASFAGLRRFA